MLAQTTRHSAGPVDVILSGDDRLVEVATNAMSLFSAPWPSLQRRIRLEFRVKDVLRPAAGSYLSCARMNVDYANGTYAAAAVSGVVALGETTYGEHEWTICVPRACEFSEQETGDIEDALLLALTIAWRDCGWEPVHAAAVTKAERCMLFCATSGGGKSTLTAALVRRGWSALGDDKLLLAMRGDAPYAASLMRTFNLDPLTAQWFAELDGIEALPRYSAWTPKRRVDLGTMGGWSWSGGATLTDIVRIQRTDAYGAVAVREMSPAATLATLLRQIVIPNDTRVAASTLRTAARTLKAVRGHVLEIGENAYARADVAAAIEARVA